MGRKKLPWMPLLLLSVGVMLFASPYFLATLNYIPEDVFWRQLHPGGSASNPTQLTPGETISVYCELVYHDAQTHVAFPDPKEKPWTVTVTVAHKDYSSEYRLDFIGTYPNVDGRYTTTLYSMEWTVPNDPGASVRFSWRVALPSGETFTKETYATIATPTAPDGYFKINGRRADAEAVFNLISPTIEIEFVATQGAEKIEMVWVDIWRMGEKTRLDLTESAEGTWSASYTLPVMGRYDLWGYIWDGSEGGGIRKMSLTIYYGEERPPVFQSSLLRQIIGLVLIAVGLWKLAERR